MSAKQQLQQVHRPLRQPQLQPPPQQLERLKHRRRRPLQQVHRPLRQPQRQQQLQQLKRLQHPSRRCE